MATQSRPPTRPPGARRPVLLLTRPAEAALRFADQVRLVLGGPVPGGPVRVIIAPLIASRFLSPPLPAVLASGRVRGIMFTSETGVAGFGRISADRHLPAYCVGPRTTEAARAAGFTATELGGDAEGLLAGLVALAPKGPLLHARATDVRGDLAARLSAAGIETHELVVYTQREQPLSRAARAALRRGAPVLAPVFSPRSATLFAAAAADAAAPLHLAAISQAAAAPLLALRPARLVIAETPDADGMVRAVAALWRGLAAP